MMSRPILTKKIKLNKHEYNLELWSTADDVVSDSFEMPPNFQKDLFSEMGSPTSSIKKQHVDRYQERFDDWFDKLPPNDQHKYVKAIDESKCLLKKFE